MAKRYRDFFSDTEEVERIFEQADRYAKTARTQEFVIEMYERFEEYGLDAFITVDQLEYLKDIAGE